MKKLPDVESVTKSLKAIPQLVEVVSELIKSPAGMIIFSLILIWTIKSLGAFRFVELFGRRSRARARTLEKYLENPGERDQRCVAVLRDLSDAEHFRLATKIYAEKLRRSALIDLHSRVQHRVTWLGIRRALPYFEYHQNGTVSIRSQTLSEKLGYRYNQFMMWSALLGGVSLICLLLLTQHTRLQAVILLGGLPLSIIIGIFAAYQNLPEYFIKRIQVALAEQVPVTAGNESVTSAPPVNEPVIPQSS